MVFLLAALLIASCSLAGQSLVDKTLVLEYQDFGPSDIAEEILGPSHWQWDNGHYDTPQQFTINVVVYRGLSLSDVKKAFPVQPKEKKDFRYVEYDQAVLWHDKYIAQFNRDLSNGEGDINIVFFHLRNLYKNALKIERVLRK